MKKVFTLFAAVAMLASTGFAQPNMVRRTDNGGRFAMPAKQVASLVMQAPLTHGFKAAGDTINTFPWSEGFEGTTAAGFSFIDADGDGNNWVFGTAPSMNVHGGNGCIYSASWLGGTVLTPNNWMILPAFELPADASEFNLSWFARGQDPDYANEHYSVYVCTTGNTPADFTATTPVYDGVSTDEYVKYTVDLSTYGGQTIFIAFRHWNSTDVFYLNIDDIRVGGAEAPEVSVDGPAAVEVNTAATFTATGASSFTWSVDGATQSATGDTLTYTFTTTGNHSVVAEASNAAGSASDTLHVNVYSCDEAVTANPWEEGFEENSECWSYVFGNATDSVWIYSAAQYAHSGNNFVVFMNDTNNTVADGWAISPKLTIPSSLSNVTLSYYIVRSEASDHIQVLVSTTASTDTADFTLLYDDATVTAAGYERRVIDMSAYVGETVRIAFHNTSVGGRYLTQLDDIRLGAMELPEIGVAGPAIVIAGNAATYVAYSGDVNTFSWEVNGVAQSATSDTLV